MSEGSPPSHRTADEAVRRHRASHHPLLVGPVELPSPRAALFMLGMRAHDGPADQHGRTRLLFAPEMRAASRMTTNPTASLAGNAPDRCAKQAHEACARGAWPTQRSPDRACKRCAKPAFAGRGLQPKWPTNASGARLVPAVLGLSFKKYVRFHRVTPALPAPSVPAPSAPAPSMPAPSKRSSPLASMGPMPLRKNPAVPWTLLTIKTLVQSLGTPIWLDFTVQKPPDGQK